VITIIKKME